MLEKLMKPKRKSSDVDTNQQETGSSKLQIGAGIYDITGPCAEAGMFGYAQRKQVSSGIHMRLRSRAFFFQSDSDHFVFVSVDTGQITEALKQEVVVRLNTRHPENLFTTENVMLSAVHTHCAPGGLSHFLIYSMHPPLQGFDSSNFDCVVNGIVESISRAFHNKQDAVLRVATGDCLGASINRSSSSYLANPKEERDLYKYDTDKQMTLWRMDGVNGFPIGMINWFAVHPTSMGSWYTLITGDNKGYASQIFEQEHGTNHLMDKPRSFVAAFAQSNEGDVSPNIFGPRDKLNLEDDSKRMFIVANAQLKTARELYEKALESPPVAATIKIAHQYVDFTNIPLKPKWHQYPECQPVTCKGCIGLSMLSGTLYDGRGSHLIREGIRTTDLSIPTTLNPQLQKEQMEKPITFSTSEWGFSPSILPLQLALIGDHALAAIPFEASTMAGRRIRSSLTNSLFDYTKRDRSDKKKFSAVICGLSNAYCGYLVTREEYAIQNYEGASTHFGPNQLVATQQQFDILAQVLVEGGPVTTLSAPFQPPFSTTNWNLNVIYDGISSTRRSFGDLVNGKDVHSSYSPGDTVDVCFHAGHPKNDYRIQGSYLEVQRFLPGSDRENKKGLWIVYADDSDYSTTFEWKRVGLDASTVQIKWVIPDATPLGKYRIKHNGNYKKPFQVTVESYVGYSSEFLIEK